MVYETRKKKISQFTAGSAVSDDTKYSALQNGINKTFTQAQLIADFADVYGASLRTYATQSAMVADDIALGEYAIVEENEYAFYKVTNVAATGKDVALTSGLTAEYQLNLKQDTVEVESMDDLINRSISAQTVYVTGYYNTYLPEYGTTAQILAGPKGGHYRYKTGGTNTSPTVGSPVSVSTIGTGTQAGYAWDASGAEWFILFENREINVFALGATGDGSTDDTTAIADTIAIANTTGYGVFLPVPDSGYVVTTIDLEGFAGQYFMGAGKASTKITISGTQTNAIIVNSGVNGSSGSINNRRIGGFRVDCTSATVTVGVYCDNFKRGEIFDIECNGAATNFRFGYGWINILRRLTAIDHTANGFLFEGTSVNAIICEDLSATTSESTAINYNIKANSLTLIRPSSEGTPLEGFTIADGSRQITIDGAHVESTNCGIYSDLTTANNGVLSIRNCAFFDCDDVLNMRAKCSHVTFKDNALEHNTIANISVSLNADSFDVGGNHIEGGTAQQEVDMYSFNSVNNMDRVGVSESSRKVTFNSAEFEFTDRSFPITTSLADIETYVDVPAGSAGEMEVIQRLSGTNTSIERLLWRVNEDDSVNSASIGGVGTTLISAIGYNGTTDRLQVDAVNAGTVFLRITCYRD